MFDRQLNNLLDLLDLLVQASNLVVGRVRDLFHHHERNERVDLVGQDLVQLVAIVPQRDAHRRRELVDVDCRVDVRHVFALGVNLDEDLFPAHKLDDLADVRAGLLQQLQLLTQHPYLGIELVALSLETADVLDTERVGRDRKNALVPVFQYRSRHTARHRYKSTPHESLARGRVVASALLQRVRRSRRHDAFHLSSPMCPPAASPKRPAPGSPPLFCNTL